MAKKFSLKTLCEHQFERYDLSQEWIDAIGKAEKGFNCIVWGKSGSGKTTFALKMCAELAGFGRVFYNSLEQGFSGALQDNVKSAGIDVHPNKNNIMFGCYQYEEMLEDLKKNKARFIVIDSCQYMGKQGLTYTQYKELKEFCKKNRKSIIVISHASGEHPKGNYAKAIRYDVDIKIYVANGRAKADSRYGATQPYTIFEQKKKEGSLF